MVKRGVRGQVSLFIILALLILLAIGLLIYVRSRQVPVVTRTDVPEEFLPVLRYVESCLSSTAERAVRLAGVQAGYTQIPEPIASNPEAYLTLVGSMKLPFWYYNRRSAIPSNTQIEQGLASYVESQITKCLNDFQPLQESFEIRADGPLRAEAFIKEEGVQFSLRYPLTVSSHKSSARIDIFRAEVPVRMGRILRLAREVMNAENRQAWLEQATISLMASMPESQVPFTSLELSCIPKQWKVEEVKREVQMLLKHNLPRVRLAKTAFMPFERPLAFYKNLGANTQNLPDDVPEYSMLFWDPLSEDFSDMRIGFVYLPEWGMLFSPSPSEGGLMRSHSTQGGSTGLVNLASTCIQFHHFSYTMQYPVRATIYDDNSLRGEGYAFSFGFPVIIRNNRGLRSYQPSAAEETLIGEDFCSSRSEQQFSVFVTDAKTHDKLAGAQVSFSCISYLCPLGSTDAEYGRLLTGLPEGCIGGSIIAEKPGYLKARKQLAEGERTVDIALKPLKPVNAVVMKYDNTSKTSSMLSGSERAALYLTLKGGSQDSYNMVTADSAQTIEVVESDMEYELNIFLFDGDTLLGGYKGRWRVEPAQLAAASSVEFYAYAFPATEEGKILEIINANYNATELKPKPR